MNKLKQILKQLIPPLFVGALKYHYSSKLYKHGFKSWEEAAKISTTYDNPDVFDKTLESSRRVRDGLSIYERDSVIFDEIYYDWPFLSSLFFIALECGRLNVIDFGGSLGTTYRQNKKYLDAIKVKKNWTIIEQEKFVDIGRQEFTNEELKFSYSLNEVREEDIDVVILSCTLCYLENPYQVLEKIFLKRPKFIVITRNPTIEFWTDTISLQLVPSTIYKASYPLWHFSYDKFIEFFKKNYDLISEWEDELQDFDRASSTGFFFRLK